MDPHPPSSASGEPTRPPESAASPASGPEDNVTVILPQGRRASRRRESIRPHDFRQSAFLAPSELRRIRLRHEQFVRALAARLSIYLRVECTLRIARLQVVGYQTFAEGLPNPTHITLFKAEPLRGVCLLVIPPRFGLAIVDRLLGGPGQVAEASRDLSEIETALLDQASQILLTEWCNHWQDLKALRPALIGHENNARFLQTAPPDTAMLSLTLDASLGEAQDQMQLVFPYYAVEPLVRLLAPVVSPEAEAAPSVALKMKWKPELGEIALPITAQWAGLQATAREVSRLRTGDVLLLGPHCAAQVQIRLARVPKFLGRLGTCGSRWAVELTEPIPA